MNNTLDKSLGEAKAFARIVMDAFDELTDKVPCAPTWSID